MSKFIQITPEFAVAGQLSEDDYARAAEAGFVRVINNRPNGEEATQPNAEAAAATATAAGLAYAHVPTTKHDIFTDEVISGMADALASAEGPVLAHCKSGQRSAIVWAAAAARTAPVDDVLKSLADAGFDFGFLRDELDRQHDRHRWSPAKSESRAAGNASPERSVAAA